MAYALHVFVSILTLALAKEESHADRCCPGLVFSKDSCNSCICSSSGLKVRNPKEPRVRGQLWSIFVATSGFGGSQVWDSVPLAVPHPLPAEGRLGGCSVHFNDPSYMPSAGLSDPLPSLAVHPFVGSLPRRSTVWSHEISTYMTELEFNRTFFNVPDPRAPEKQRARSLPAMRGKLESADEAHRVNAIWRSYTRYVLQRLDDWRRSPGGEVSEDGSEDSSAEPANVPITETAEEDDEIPLAIILDDLLRPPVASQAAPGPAGAVSPTLPSNGSLGHPDLCRSACVFVVGGTCLNGQSCTYCHLPHDEKRAKLDKRQRGWLKELSESQLLPILLDHMEARAEDKGFARQAMGLLQLLQRRLRVLPPAARPETVLAPKKLRNLDRALSRMTFFQLLRLAPQDDQQGHAIAQAIYELRRAAI